MFGREFGVQGRRGRCNGVHGEVDRRRRGRASRLPGRRWATLSRRGMPCWEPRGLSAMASWGTAAMSQESPRGGTPASHEGRAPVRVVLLRRASVSKERDVTAGGEATKGGCGAASGDVGCECAVLCRSRSALARSMRRSCMAVKSSLQTPLTCLRYSASRPQVLARRQQRMFSSERRCSWITGSHPDCNSSVGVIL
jgi:hypothetical protein